MSNGVCIPVVPSDLLTALAAEGAPVTPAVPPATAPAAVAGGNGAFTSRLLVAQWLAERGVPYRVKPQPDGRGRTVYVLKQCPFDPAHGDPDACIMQDPSGKMSAQCFHNSCQGRGWQDFKEALGAPNRHHYDPPLRPPRRSPKPASNGQANGAIHENGIAHVNGQMLGAPPPESPPASFPPAETGPRLPQLQGNKRQLRHVTADALAALLASNNPPAIFQRGEVLTRLRLREIGGVPYLEPLEDYALRGVLARVADWLKIRETKHGDVIEEDAPPMEVVKDLANLPGWGGIPPIEAVVESPVFARTGELIMAQGFHAGARLWYQAASGLDVPPVSPAPTASEIACARDLLLAELLGDFPFADQASKAHALAALLLPFVRQLVDGPTPMHLLDAPVEGTGKTLLATVIALVSTGREAEPIAEATCDEEWRKRITAVLAGAPTFVLLDNLNRTLDSGALASVLTSRVWKDRILGVSKTATLPNTCIWLASGNNTRLSRELIRRTLWCRLDARLDAPWERTTFRHPNLIAWAKAHRGHLVHAALTLCQAWLTAGKPTGSQSLGMFEAWAEVIGGILEVARVPGLLANSKTFRATHADQVGEWRAFVAAWWETHAETTVGVEELFTLASDRKLLDGVLGDKGERSQRTRLGQALAKAADRVCGDYRLERAGEDHKARQQYRLRQVSDKSVPDPDGNEFVLDLTR